MNKHHTHSPKLRAKSPWRRLAELIPQKGSQPLRHSPHCASWWITSTLSSASGGIRLLLAPCHGIRLSGSRFDRPKSDPELMAEKKRQFLDDQRQGNSIQGKIRQGKRRLGLGLISEKLAATQGSAIARNVLVLNLEKLLELLFAIFTALLHLLLVNEGGRNVRTMPL